MEENGNFIMPCHEGLSAHEAANKIADHFSKVSTEFHPFNFDELPSRVQQKIRNPESFAKIPDIEEFQVFEKIQKAHKPKSGVAEDLPRRLIN